MNDDRKPLRRVGVLWKPKPGGKTLGSGSLTIGDRKQRFLILLNDKKQKETEPDYLLMSSDDPEVDQYAQRQGASTGLHDATNHVPRVWQHGTARPSRVLPPSCRLRHQHRQRRLPNTTPALTFESELPGAEETAAVRRQRERIGRLYGRKLERR